MAFLIAEKKLETEQSCWYRFVCDTPADILNLPNATDSGKSYTTKKLALKTSLAYCIGTSRIYMLDSTNQWRLLAGITDIELAAMAVKAEDILAYRNEAERFKDITIERAAAALASQNASKDSADDAAASAKEAQKYKDAAASSASEALKSKSAAKDSEDAARQYSESAKDAIATAKKDYSGGYLKTYELTAPKSGWKTLNPARGQYTYYCDISVPDLTERHSPFAATGLDSYSVATVARLANCIETRNGSVRLFSKKVPTDDIDFVLTIFGIGTLNFELTLTVADWKKMEKPIGPNRYYCDISVPGCLSTLTPIATTSLENSDAAGPAGLANIVETHDGFVRFYAVRVPDANIGIIMSLIKKEDPVNRPATRTELGLVKIGDGINVDGGGGISARAATDEEFNAAMDDIFGEDG